MKLKRNDLIGLFNGLRNVINLEGAKFSYAVAKNVKNIAEELKALDKFIKPSPEYDVWQRERVAICEKYAEKDKNGKAIIERDAKGKGHYKGLENNEEFNEQMKILNKKYEKVSNERIVQIKNYESKLEEEVEVKIHKIKKSDIPEGITPEKLLPIMTIIEGE